MQNQLTNKKMWVWVGILLIILLLSQYLSTQNQLKEYPIYASDSPSPTGVKAFYTYVKNHKDVVKRWSNSPIQLPNHPENQLLIMIEPYFIPNSVESNAYKSFMEAGNTILLFKGNPKGMFGLETEFAESDSGFVFDSAGSEYLAEVLAPVRLQTRAEDEIMLSDDAGTIALKRPFGNGQLIVANSPSWLMNGKILTDDHLALVLALIKDENSQTLLFDEYLHGDKNTATVLTIYPHWFLLVMVHGGLLILLWLWYKGKRFGPIFIPREESVRFSDEGIQALAAWYIKGRHYHDSLSIQSDYVKTLLQEHWRIPSQEEWRDLTIHFERRWPQMPKAELASLLSGLTDVLRNGKVSKQEYLLWSKKLEEIRKEVEAR